MPRRLWRSATMVGASSAMVFSIEVAQCAAGIGKVACAGVEVADFLVPQIPKSEETLLPPEDVLPARRILRVQSARQVENVASRKFCRQCSQ